jgi:hypothetical protein
MRTDKKPRSDVAQPMPSFSYTTTMLVLIENDLELRKEWTYFEQ